MNKYVLSVDRRWVLRLYRVLDLSLVAVIFPFALRMIDQFAEDLMPDQLDIIEWVYNNYRSPMLFSR